MTGAYAASYLPWILIPIVCWLMPAVVNTQHDIFKGHFPGQPVVPGVCMMEMVKELLEQQTDQRLWMRNAGQVKFLQMITPDVQPMVEISWKQTGKNFNVNASIKNNASDLFKLSGDFEKK